MPNGTRFCPECKMPMPEVERVCSHCGHDLRVAERRSFQRMNAVLSGLAGAAGGAVFGFYLVAPKRYAGRHHGIDWASIPSFVETKYIIAVVIGLIVGGAIGAVVGYYAREHWRRLSEPTRPGSWRSGGL